MTLTADSKKRLMLPGAAPGDVFDANEKALRVFSDPGAVPRLVGDRAFDATQFRDAAQVRHGESVLWRTPYECSSVGLSAFATKGEANSPRLRIEILTMLAGWT